MLAAFLKLAAAGLKYFTLGQAALPKVIDAASDVKRAAQSKSKVELDTQLVEERTETLDAGETLEESIRQAKLRNEMK